MASQENQRSSVPTTNQPSGDASPHCVHDTDLGESRARGSENPKFEGRGHGSDRRNRGARGYQGNRGNRGERAGQGGSKSKKDIGRAEWARKPGDRRARNSEQAAKRQKLDGEDRLPVYATKFSKEEIEAQEKKPKRKVAVMLGYSGTGYKGMQLNHHEKTIEGDLFKAFVDAGAISKANADDPKKSSLVRCARTDKGVHAAGNVISLKLIIEDPHIVTRINEHLNPQIRVWGIERTNGSFSCYQHCDSRRYQYLIPSHCFLPPHPKSFLAKQMVELAEEENDSEGYQTRQKEVEGVWSKLEAEHVRPAIEEIDPSIRDEVLRIFYAHENKLGDRCSTSTTKDTEGVANDVAIPAEKFIDITENENRQNSTEDQLSATSVGTVTVKPIEAPEEKLKEPTPVEIGLRLLRAAYIKAKKTYRIHPDRVTRIRSHLSRYIGTHSFHNYTIGMTSKDPSAQRIIKAFTIDADPIIINDTEWLSLKVWGQSFMMHQIRKMVSMVALLVRCGCHEGRIQDSYMADRINIPKAPSLGLLLEYPVFEAHNEKLEGLGRNRIDFGRYEKEMEEFKQREIFERIFREEDKYYPFHTFFAGLDYTRDSQLLYLSSVGFEATKRSVDRDTLTEATTKRDIEDVESEDEGDAINGEG